MRPLLILLVAASLSACGPSDPKPVASKPPIRIYTQERDTYQRAKEVNNTVMQVDQARREHEERETQQ